MQQPDHTRRTLLLRLNAAGSEREIAWREFYRQYEPIIAAFARRLGARPAEAEELVQDVMQAFFHVTPEFVYDPSKGSFRGYLKTAVCRKLHAVRRRRATESARVASDLDPNTLPAKAVDSAWEEAWTNELLNRALDKVRERYSVNPTRSKTFSAFERVKVHGQASEVVAEELRMSPESVRAALSRVGNALAKEYSRLKESVE